MRRLLLLSALPLSLATLLGCSRSMLPLEPGADAEPAGAGPPAAECEQGNWARALAASVGPQATGVAVDRGCNVLVVGSFIEAVDLGDGPLVSAGGADIFVAKLTTDGETVWSRRFGGVEDEQAVKVAVSPDGGVVFTGHADGTIDFGGGPLEGVGRGAFLAKLDEDGEHVFSRRFGTETYQSVEPVRITGLAVGPDGEAALKGYFDGIVDFGGGPVESAGLDDIFVAKYDRTGAHVFDRRFGDAEYQNDSGGIAVDGQGNVVFVGDFQGTIDFGDGPIESAGDHDLLLAKLDPGGDTVWARTFGGKGAEQAGPIAVDSRGRVAVAGSFEGAVDFGGGPMTSTQGYHFNLFVAEVDGNGQHRWSKRFGDVDGEEAIGLGYDALDRLMLVGNFAGALVFGGEGLITAGGWDVFAVRFGAEGNPAESRRFGDKESQRCEGIAVDPLGHVLMTGSFSGQVDFGGGPLQGTPGDADAFVARLPIF